MKNPVGKVIGIVFLFYFLTFWVGFFMDGIFPGDLAGLYIDVRKYLMPVYWGLVCLSGVIAVGIIYILYVIRQQTKIIEELLKKQYVSDKSEGNDSEGIEKKQAD